MVSASTMRPATDLSRASLYRYSLSIMSTVDITPRQFPLLGCPEDLSDAYLVAQSVRRRWRAKTAEILPYFTAGSVNT